MALAPNIDDFEFVHAKPPPPELDNQRWPGNYRAWIEANDTLSDADRAAIRGRIASMPRRPKISVLMPVHNTPVRHLIAAVNSVRRQLYPHWEICIADDCSTSPEVVAILQRLSSRDPRIRVTYRSEPGHIARASNDALALASGDFVALLDHDDLLTEHALYMVAEEINAHPDVVILYSDEDKVDADNVRYGPYFKQHFNRDILMAQNCVNHLGVFRRSIMLEVHGFVPGTEGAQDYDMTLRMLERASDAQVRHIPHVLYHWRAVPGSTALDPMAKTYAFEAGHRAIAHHFERLGEDVAVQHGAQLGVYRLLRRKPTIDVSLIVTGYDPHVTAERDDLAWLQGTLHDARMHLSEVMVAAPSDAVAATAPVGDLRDEGLPVRGITVDASAAWPVVANSLAAEASGEVLIFLTAGLQPTASQVFRELVTHAHRPGVAAAGGRLQRADGSVLHDGYVIGHGGVCGSMHLGWPAQSPGYFGLNQMTRLCAAACGHAFAVRRDLFVQAKGFDVDFAAAWADVDLCLRLRQRGHSIVYTPFASFCAPAHLQVPANNVRETVRLMHRHRALARVDPFWNPNFIKQPGAFDLARDTTDLKPWCPYEARQAAHAPTRPYDASGSPAAQ